DKVASGKLPSSSPPPKENKALFVEQNEGSNAIHTLEERNLNDDIYYCEECNGQTIAHIECVLAKVEDNIEIIGRTIRKSVSEKR
ncbi:hypothetical protein Goklo_029020, partial [Gossypium klotzschianum]|nr:hypothetical protein [Gossypium klotzschianum]